MGKRSPGHIEQLPSGSWRVKVYGGTDPLTGREIRLRKTCKTERAAQIELGKLLEQAAAGRQPETNATVAELMDKYAEVADWDHDCKRAGCQPHVCRPLTAKTIRNIHNILSGAFSTAERWEWISWNPTESAKPPPGRQQRHDLSPVHWRADGAGAR
jgi:integrase